jgi:hypothetical protein
MEEVMLSVASSSPNPGHAAEEMQLDIQACTHESTREFAVRTCGHDFEEACRVLRRKQQLSCRIQHQQLSRTARRALARDESEEVHIGCIWVAPHVGSVAHWACNSDGCFS